MPLGTPVARFRRVVWRNRITLRRVIVTLANAIESATDGENAHVEMQTRQVRQVYDAGHPLLR
jgi:hypothetical protein